MKKALLLLLTAVAVLSCGKSGSSKVGQYIYTDAAFTISLELFEGSDTGITVFQNGKYVYQDLAGKVNGSEYRYDALKLTCTFDSDDAITARISEDRTGLNLPSSMVFSRSDRVLDVNGDGLLD